VDWLRSDKEGGHHLWDVKRKEVQADTWGVFGERRDLKREAGLGGTDGDFWRRCSFLPKLREAGLENFKRSSRAIKTSPKPVPHPI